MRDQNTMPAGLSIVNYETLESWTRAHIQEQLQHILEEEVTALLGREPSQRKPSVDSSPGYRNGHGKPRRLAMSNGTVTVRRPRVRGLEESFESKILPFFQRQTKEVGELLPKLYLHGLALRDFELAMRGLLGAGAPLSPSSIARLKEQWQGEYDQWRSRSIAHLDVVYLWGDGIYVKAGLEKEKAALMTLIAALRDGTKVILTVECGHRESTETWLRILRDLKARGLKSPKLVMGDGALGLWTALAQVFPEAKEQRCWNHRIINVNDRIAKKDQPAALKLLKEIPYAPTRDEAERRKKRFQEWCGEKHEAAAKLIEQDWGRMTTFYDFPKEHWVHLRTTNIVESPFASIRLRTDAAKRFKKTANATAMIWKLLLVAEKSFRKLNAPHLMASVADGMLFQDGEEIQHQQRVAA